MSGRTSALAFAPATIGNVAVGFDVLGFALDGPGDRVRASFALDGPPVQLEAVRGVVPELPVDPARNTAAVAAQHLLTLVGATARLRLALDKGIPLGSGMGGSAASAVAAAVAVDALLETALSTSQLLACALAGEAAASGSAHADNAAPCLVGGLTAVLGQPPHIVALPVPAAVRAVVVHPDCTLLTAQARAVLSPTIPLTLHVRQQAALAGFVSACYSGDLALLGETLVDWVVEPQRARLIPGFAAARAAALGAGALGFSIAGAGPSVFAWCADDATAAAVAAGVRRAFAEAGLASESFVGPVRRQGAVLEEVS